MTHSSGPANTVPTVPLQGLAEQLKLPIHPRDTFTGWQPPQPDGEPINLIIAVSFGLFVPRRLLRGALYGGLNVHPSLLPDLRGPAPLQHALLADLPSTGVSLQTLSDEAFDAGLVLAQTPRRPGIPIPAGCSVAELGRLLAPVGADMLVRALRAGLHVPPLSAAGWDPSTPEERAHLRHAPKITAADRRVAWAASAPGGRSAADLAARARLLGPLWGRALRCDGSEKRVILEGVEVAASEDWPEEMVRSLRAAGKARENGGGGGAEGDPAGETDLGVVTWVEEVPAGEGDAATTGTREVDIPYFPDGDAIIVPVAQGGGCVRIRSIKVEGENSRPAAAAIEAFSKSCPRDGPWDLLWQALPGPESLMLPIEMGLKKLLP